MRRDEAVRLLGRLHEAQNEFYGGGTGVGLDQLLTPEITWIVPGKSHVAGVDRGLEEVLGYFRLRRRLAGGTFQMTRRDVLVGEESRLAALTDGTALIDGVRRHWSTIGLYEWTASGSHPADCWHSTR